jgi:phenylalanyl-tRNA synthetase alpha chain
MRRSSVAGQLLATVSLARRCDASLVGTRLHSPAARLVRGAVRCVASVPARKYQTDDAGNNVTPYIENLVGRGLHLKPDHPLGIIKGKIEDYFDSLDGAKFAVADNLDPLVNAQECFDDLLIPADHPGRKPSDTYYVRRDGGKEVSSAADQLLRTHTSAHQSTLMRQGLEAFLCTGDVYRRDEIDASHFPAFHQMEGVKLFEPGLVGGEMAREAWLASPGCELVATDLKLTLEGLCDGVHFLTGSVVCCQFGHTHGGGHFLNRCDALFGPVEKRWNDDYFPFTEPSFELEIKYGGGHFDF